MNYIVLVTGATSGFGRAIAEKFAANKYNIIITGRRNELLQEVAEKIKQQYAVEILTLNLDVRNKTAVDEKINNLPKQWQKINVLVNNAGLALGRGYFEEADINDWDTMIDTNVKGLVYVSRAVLPYMIASGKGHIINIGSIAGKHIYEKGNMYCTTKHAVDAISHAMRVDLLRHKIKVTAIHPGAAETEFSIVRFKGDKIAADKVYEGYTPLSAEDIADATHYCASLPDHVCINELVITPTAQADPFYLYKE